MTLEEFNSLTSQSHPIRVFWVTTTGIQAGDVHTASASGHVCILDGQRQPVWMRYEDVSLVAGE